MSYENTARIFDTLNAELEQRYISGDHLHLTVHGKPEFHIVSFDPFAYERYGSFRNRAPYVSGELVLRKFLYHRSQQTDGAIVYAGVQGDFSAYAFGLNGYDPRAIRTINNVAQALGHAELEVK